MAARRPKRRKTRRASKPTRRRKAARPSKPRARPKRKRAAAPRPAAAAPASGQRIVAGAPVEVGVVLHFYPRAAAAVVALSRPIHRGDTIHVRGQTTDFVQPVSELALEGAAVSEGAP